jgi:hypothetical protein
MQYSDQFMWVANWHTPATARNLINLWRPIMNVRNRFAVSLAAVLTAIAALFVFNTTPAFSEGRSDSPGGNSVAGAWRVNLSGFGPNPVPILMTFTRDGTLLQTDTPVALPQPVPPSSAASNGHGIWRKTASREYAFTYVKIFYSPDGPALATATQRAKLTLAEDGNSFTAAIVGTDFVNADGTPINPGAVATLTFAGSRITLPETQ